MSNTGKKTDQFISYGFRIRERLGVSNGEIREIIMKAHKAFRLLAEDYSNLENYMTEMFQKYPELTEEKKAFENRKSEFQIVLENDPDLDNLIEKWIVWGIEKDEAKK